LSGRIASSSAETHAQPSAGHARASVVLQVNRDAGCPPGVTSDWGEKTCRFGPLPNRTPGVVAIESSSSQCRSMLERRQPDCSGLLEEILNEYISIVTRASKAWIPELISSAGAEVTEIYIDFFFTVKKGKTPAWSREDAKTLLDSITGVGAVS
jgi:hypothetical protein